MASNGVSNVSSSPASGLSRSRGAGGVGSSGSSSVSTSGSRGVQGDASGSNRQAAPRPIISVDGQDLNRSARRGTYVNILV